METFFVISDALTFFSHKVIFPVDNNIKKFGNIEDMGYIWVYVINVMQILRVIETNMELEQK